MRRSNKVAADLDQLDGSVEVEIIEVSKSSTAVVLGGLRRTTNNVNRMAVHEESQTTVVTGGLRRSAKANTDLLEMEAQAKATGEQQQKQAESKQEQKKVPDLKAVLETTPKALKALHTSKQALVCDNDAHFRHSHPIAIPSKVDQDALYHSAGHLPRHLQPKAASESDSDDDIFAIKQVPSRQNHACSTSYSDDDSLVIKL